MAGLAKKEIKATIGDKREQNAVDRLLSLIENIRPIIQDIQNSCSHEAGYLIEDLILEPARIEGAFLATDRGLLRTFRVLCKKCGKELRLFVGEFCPACFIAMEEAEDLSLLKEAIGDEARRCPKCGLVVVWNRLIHDTYAKYDFQHGDQKSGQ